MQLAAGEFINKPGKHKRSRLVETNPLLSDSAIKGCFWSRNVGMWNRGTQFKILMLCNFSIVKKEKKKKHRKIKSKKEKIKKKNK